MNYNLYLNLNTNSQMSYTELCNIEIYLNIISYIKSCFQIVKQENA